MKQFLEHLGWNAFFENQINQLNINFEQHTIARVVNEEREHYRIQYDTKNLIWAELSGKFRFTSSERADYPAVGDWVVCDIPMPNSACRIHQRLERKTLLKRKAVASGSKNNEQLFAANIDHVFIATSLNQDLNVNRLDRYLAMAWDSGAKPVLVLTKADLCQDPEQSLSLLEEKYPFVDVCQLSANTGYGLEHLNQFLKPGSTGVLVGSSGVGKSTLLNRLLGSEQIKTQQVREDDDKGRHTTTSRHLFILKSGSMLIDTPGIRELQMLDFEDGLSNVFLDIESRLGQCRFTNCRHESEPGCVIQQALNDGLIKTDRWTSYKKLQREMAHVERKADKLKMSEERKKWKKISTQLRQKKFMK